MAGYIMSIKKEDNIQVIQKCFETGIYSTILKQPDKLWGAPQEGTFADYLGMKPGDNIYFFSDRKIYGIGKLISINGECKYWSYVGADKAKKYKYEEIEDSILVPELLNECNRCVCFFEPSPLFFKNGIDTDDVLNSNPDKFKMLRVFSKLSFIKIDDTENQALMDILLKRNEITLVDKISIFNFDKKWHNKIKERITDSHKMSVNEILNQCYEKEKITHEMAIEAALVELLTYKDNSIFGKWDYISHQVAASPFKPIIYVDKMDIFGYRYIKDFKTISKFLVIEIKRDKADINSLYQIMKYVDYVKSEYSFNDYGMIEAYLVAAEYSQEVLDEIESICIRNYIIGYRPSVAAVWNNIKLIQYKYQSNKLFFEEVTY